MLAIVLQMMLLWAQESPANLSAPNPPFTELCALVELHPVIPFQQKPKLHQQREPAPEERPPPPGVLFPFWLLQRLPGKC